MSDTSLACIAQLIGEAGRIRMLTALLDGNAHSASQLAMTANVSPQTASSHLSKLLAGGLIVSEARGRQRFFRLKSGDVATAIESVGALADPLPADRLPELRFARSCYDHLAGALSISLKNTLLERQLLRQRKKEFVLTAAGEHFLGTLGIRTDLLRKSRRSFSRVCLDGTEREHHIGGAVGAALLTRFLELKWLARVRGTRIVRVTLEGERHLERSFDLRWAALRGTARPSV